MPEIYILCVLRTYEIYFAFYATEILEPIMGKGLIPADPVTWKKRRRQIVPGFHKGTLRLVLYESLRQQLDEAGSFLKCSHHADLLET